MTNNFPEIKYNIYLFALILAVCFAFSAGVRFQQFETWEKTPSYYFVGELPLMTTLDAPYWLRFARNYNNGKYVKDSRFGIDYLRGYPTNSEILNELTSQKKFTDHFHSQPTSEVKKYKYSDIHLLSFLIAKLVPYFNYNYYLTGTLLIPVLASLFILPLGIYFFRLGVPISGLLGGLIGTFAGGYYMRSSIGRIDTDSLNLFFPALIALMILLAILSKSERSVLLYSICAGLSLFCFQWWYSKEGFSLVYFTVLVISLFLQKIRFGIILFSALLFVLCVHPETFMNGIVSIVGFVERYFSIDIKNDVLINNGTIPAIFPNTMTTISEVEHVTTDEIIRRVLSNTFLGWVGLITFLALAIWRWKVLLPLVPMLALGLLSFQSSNRFIMFLGPFIGLGLGWLAQLGFEFIFFLIAKTFVHRKVKDGYKVLSNKSALYIKFDVKSVSKKNRSPLNTGQDLSLDTLESNTVNKGITDINWWNWVRQVVLYLGIGGIFWGISAQTAMSFVPRPSIHPQIYASFLDVKKLVPPNSAILTWWDYGYAITDATDLATFHDGGVQKSPKTYFIARSLISPDQDEFYNITQFLATEGNLGIEKNNSSPEALLKAVRNPEHKPLNPIYLFFTADMTGKYGAISKLGSWDIEKGGSKPRAYQNLACNKITNDKMNCRGANINLKDGFINDKLSLRRLIFIRKGQVLREKKFGHAHGYTLQVIVAGNNIVEVQLIDEAVFLSNYNQMFLLGRYRKDLFEEAYNAFPFSRLYRISY